MTIRILRLDAADDVDAARDTYHRVEASSFGLPTDPAYHRAKAPLVDPRRWYLAHDGDSPCGGVGSFSAELTLPGGAAVPVALVSDVGVLPTHRRRGVLRSLVDAQLADLSGDGVPLAALHASEGSIYRRFGYGPATWWRQLRADARRVVLRDDAPVERRGSLDLVPRPEAHAACAAVHDAARRRHAGGLSRDDDWWRVVLGDVEGYIGGSPRRLVLLHHDDSGRPDGYAIYSVREDWSSGQAQHRLEVWELVGETDAVELTLWSTLLSHDLVATVVGPAPVDHPLWDCVVDHRQVGLDWQQDLLWLRVLDVPTVLAARRYAAPGRLTLEVGDGSGPTAGVYELEVDEDGAARCAPVTRPPELAVDASELAEVVLGAPGWQRLARAGRVGVHDGDALVRADAMFTTPRLPWCWVRF